MTEPLTVATSRFLAFVLRHHPEHIGIDLDAHGWVDVEELLAAAARHGRTIDRALLEHVVATNDKRRFELRDDRIRAAQGHSVAIDLGLAPLSPPDVLFHGTVERFLTRIRAEGLVAKGRRHVHLSCDIDTATVVGTRRGEAIILRIAAGEMHTQGYAFYRSANGVWLTDHVPPKWITMNDSSGQLVQG
jgi:putative RNA 2'-phosphotransferase